jgi:hypothetical protein
MSAIIPKEPRFAQANIRQAVGHRSVGNWIHQKLTHAVGEVADVLVTSTEVLALFTTAKVIVPAPGAGKAVEFLGALVLLDYGGTAYADDAGEDLVFKYTNASGAAVSNAVDGSVWDAEADTLAAFYPLNAAASAQEIAVNAPIVLHLLTGNWATGNSPLKVRCYYRTIDLSELASIT